MQIWISLPGQVSGLFQYFCSSLLLFIHPFSSLGFAVSEHTFNLSWNLSLSWHLSTFVDFFWNYKADHKYVFQWRTLLVMINFYADAGRAPYPGNFRRWFLIFAPSPMSSQLPIYFEALVVWGKRIKLLSSKQHIRISHTPKHFRQNLGYSLGKFSYDRMFYLGNKQTDQDMPLLLLPVEACNVSTHPTSRQALLPPERLPSTLCANAIVEQGHLFLVNLKYNFQRYASGSSIFNSSVCIWPYTYPSRSVFPLC